ncbi:MAG: GntR family transcriptional regulator, partial [Dehalococcoidia bacterium]|nr:GntR family transcriptional regulator [Dehalococcoidia bacterium]
MEIVIDIDDSVPLFAQLMDQIKRAVLSDELSSGDPLPSIRQLANDLDLNNKTVAKAYRLLERDSVIQTKGYRGTFVHPDAKANSTVDLNAWVVTKLG